MGSLPALLVGVGSLPALLVGGGQFAGTIDHLKPTQSVWCGVVWCGAVWCGVVWPRTRRVNTVLTKSIQLSYLP